MTTTATRATAKQVAYIGTLAGHLDDAATTETVLAHFNAATASDLDRKQASLVIDMMVTLRDQKWAREREERRVVRDAEAIVKQSTLTPGPYMRHGVPVRLYHSRHGHLLAKALIDGEWVYQGTAHRFVTADMRMTAEQADAFGIESGICACCGRTLTARDSRFRGIGPVCWRKYF